jgi:hypothetical protein
MLPRIIYVKTPKTAGSSLRSLLVENVIPYEEVDGETKVWPADEALNKAKLIIVGDVVAKKFRQKYPGLWSESRSFAIVRHPYDKTVSAWKYCKSTRNKELKHVLSSAMPKPGFWRRYNHDYVHFTLTQSSFLVSGDQIIVERIFKFEEITQNPEGLFEFLGLKLAAIPHKNRNLRREGYSASQLPREILDMIYQRFQDDFINFNYQR